MRRIGAREPTGRTRGGAQAAWAVAAVLAAACAPLAPPEPVPAAVVATPVARPPAPAETPASAAVRAHFARTEALLRARGLMRTDTDPADVPFGVATLVRNFERIALFDEYVEAAGRLIARPTPSRLRRWETAVRLGVEFGPAVPARQRRTDLGNVRSLALRFAAITGHPISVVDDPAAANFRVLVLTEDERRAAEPELAALLPGLDPVSVSTIVEMPLGVSCLVLAFARGGSSIYSQAVALVRAELPELTRLSCFHEEIAQGLGLPNDDASVRPSVFNDVQEFALLTRHDELLLRILYDPRLRPGMTAAEARPIVERIASELLAGES